MVYNPNWYWMEDTFYRWAQRQGYVNLHVYSLAQYHSPQLWGMYHWPRQKPGYGDGRLAVMITACDWQGPVSPTASPPA